MPVAREAPGHDREKGPFALRRGVRPDWEPPGPPRESKIQPAMPETSTERTIPRGTLSAAPMVSSAAWAEASKPVIV